MQALWRCGSSTGSLGESSPGVPLRIQAEAPFRLRWSRDGWASWEDTTSKAVPTLGVYFVDLHLPESQEAPVSFTFYWTEAGHWEGRNFSVAMDQHMGA